MRKPELSERVARMESPIRDVEGKARELEKGGKKIYYLNIGDPDRYDFDAPEHVKRAYARAALKDKANYAQSEGVLELREEIGKRERVGAEDVLVTSGVSEGALFLFAALLNPGDNLLMPSPSYTQYISMCSVLGGRNNFYGCTGNWMPDLDKLRKGINARTKGIMHINPNNPTGTVCGRKIVQELADIAGEYELPLISDEIYDRIVFEGEAVSPSRLAKDIPLVTVNGFSKVYKCTGYRVGWLAFRNMEGIREGVARLCRLRLAMNTPAQKAMLAALRGPQGHIKEMVDKLRRRRDIAWKRLNGIDGLSCVKPSGAFYAFPRIHSKRWKTDKEFVYDLLGETGVLAVFGSGFSPVLAHQHFRITFLPQEKVLDEAMDRIGEFMAKRA